MRAAWLKQEARIAKYMVVASWNLESAVKKLVLKIKHLHLEMLYWRKVQHKPRLKHVHKLSKGRLDLSFNFVSVNSYFSKDIKICVLSKMRYAREG